MRKCLLLLLVGILLLCGCSPLVEPIVSVNSGEGQVIIHIKDSGIVSEHENVVIKNLYKGARAEVIYRIYNESNKVITPVIYPIMDADVSGYSKGAGYRKAPGYVESWLEFSESSPIAPGEYRDFVVAIERPNSEGELGKIGFQIGVTTEPTNLIRTSVGIWWLVELSK